MPIRLGNIAAGEDFFDRVSELEDLWRYLEGNHVSLTGPRRLGKSSLLKRLAEQAEEKGILAQLVDVEGLDTAEAFVAALTDAFPEDRLSNHMQSAAGITSVWLRSLRKIEIKLPGGIGGSIERQVDADSRWGKAAHTLQGRLHASPVLLLIDEFSVFLEKLIERDRREAEQLLGWFRRWRMSETACRFVLSGSVGINSLLERHGMITWLNDCYEFGLGPFRLLAARSMLQELARREAWEVSDEHAGHLCDKAGWLSPFYLCLLLDEAMKAGRDRLLECGGDERKLAIDDIDDGYDRLLASRSRFIHWYKRVQRDLAEPRLAFALAVLRHVAKANNALSRQQLHARLAKQEPDPARRGELLSESLAYLEENGYLGIADGKQIAFQSFVLRDYWRRNHAD